MSVINIECGKCTMQNCPHRGKCSMAEGALAPMLAGLVCHTLSSGEFLLEEQSEPEMGKVYFFFDEITKLPTVGKLDANDNGVFLMDCATVDGQQFYCSTTKLYKTDDSYDISAASN